MRENFRRIMTSWQTVDEMLSDLQGDAKAEANRIIEEQARKVVFTDALEWLKRDRGALESELTRLETEHESAKAALAEAIRAKAEAEKIYNAIHPDLRTLEAGQEQMNMFKTVQDARWSVDLANNELTKARGRLAEVNRALVELDKLLERLT